LGVPSSSFKAVDIVLTAGSIRFGDDVRRHRRLMAVTEIRKNWKGEPSAKDFVDIVRFERRGNRWKSSLAKSRAIKKIAEVKGITKAEAIRNIMLRARMKKDIVRLAKRIPEATSAPFVIAANNAYLRFSSESKTPAKAYARWAKWLGAEAKKKV
jgi:hypothetical protein